MSKSSLIGSTLEGRFKITALLGEGAMGKVYLAEHPVLGRQYAVKVLKELIGENYGRVAVNTSPDSIYTGALGAAVFASRVPA